MGGHWSSSTESESLPRKKPLTWATLLAAAKACNHRSYSPHSKFPVSAVIETASSHMFSGVNVENKSYGCTMCAEASAVANMVSSRDATNPDTIKIRKVVVYTPTSTSTIGNNNSTIAPCGKCRQMISEFALPTCEVMCASRGHSSSVINFNELYPHRF